MPRSTFLLIGALLLLIGCSASSDIIDSGDYGYSVFMSPANHIGDWIGRTEKDLMRKAEGHCKKKGGAVQVTELKKPEGGTDVMSLRFTCQ